MKKLNGFSLLLAAILVSGCSSIQYSGQSEVNSESAPAVNNKPEEPVASFEPDTLYDLLVAELGGQRKRYDLALGNYLKQAHKTQDKGIAKRAYQISQLIGARQASLDAAVLWAKLDEDNAAALQASAIELIRAGQLDRAVEQMRKVLALEGEASFDFLAASASELSEDERVQLLVTFDSILKDYPDHRSLKLGKAILLLQDNQLNEAIKLCDQLLSKDSGYVKAIILKGRILNKMGKGGEAEKMLADAVRKHPEIPRLRLIYARVLVHLDKLGEARDQFQVLLKQSPHDVEIILSLALIALENDMVDESEEYFKQLIALGQRKSTANYYLGRIAEQRGQYDQARKYFLNVMPGKEFMMSRVALIQMQLRQGKVAEARQQLDEDRNRFPAHAVQLYLLETEILVNASELDDALKLFTGAVLRYPDSVNLLYGRAMVYEKMGRIDDLEKDLRAIIKAQPENAAALNALGYTLADRTDRFEEARALIEKAYALDKEDPAIMDSMGWIYYRLGNYQAALGYLKSAYAKYPDHEVAAHLGEVLWALGRKEDAKALWDEALQKSPDSDVLKETRERLEKQSLKEAGVSPESKVSIAE
ncbi:tetratricopeptide repeat protein [Endozoicomonas numazuensis]|uniref:tetratricopeptide repeat protein n=1 Tax=Endozoicomonas numazuensis TaxID=1137799 RepID=UPI000691BCA8|nr:tetratricopeptide repeat protein [Endozoicomonas numazuensis]